MENSTEMKNVADGTALMVEIRPTIALLEEGPENDHSKDENVLLEKTLACSDMEKVYVNWCLIFHFIFIVIVIMCLIFYKTF